MDTVIDALNRKDVMAFTKEEVTWIRKGLARLIQDLPPGGDNPNPAMESIEGVDERFRIWEATGHHPECGGEEHMHSLACSVFRKAP